MKPFAYAKGGLGKVWPIAVCLITVPSVILVSSLFLNPESANAQFTWIPEPDNREIPAWSPDGRRILFVSRRDRAREIYVMNLDGSEPTRLTTTGGFRPVWSPDGQRIAFVSERDGAREIYLMNANGADQVRLTTRGGQQPTWAPDGRRIAFASARDGPQQIYITRL